MDLIAIIIKIILSIIAGLNITSPATTPKETTPIKPEVIIEQPTVTTPKETTPAKTEVVIESKPTVDYGTDGHLYIPDANISVSLQREDSTHTMQEICDMPNTACYVPFYPEDDFSAALFDDSPMIADHNYQGFNAIKTLPIGTELYIEHPDSTTEHYKLEYIDPNGTYDYADVTYLNSTFPLEWPRYSDGSFVNKGHTDCVTLYTCNQDSKHITIARFKKS